MKFLSKKITADSIVLVICFVAVVIILIKEFPIANQLNTNYASVQEELKSNVERVNIKKGDVLELTLNNTRLLQKDSNDIVRALKKVMNIDQCAPGDFYEIVYNLKTGKWNNFFYYPLGTSYYSITKSSDSAIEAEKKELMVTTTEYKKQGVIASSLWVAMAAQKIPPDIIVSFADIFAWQIDFLLDTKQGDSFKVVYEIKQTGKKNTKLSSKIIAAQYKTSSKTYKAFYFKAQNAKSGYFDENGKSVKSAFLKTPLQFRRISSYFTTSRIHPILKYPKPHLGIDYAAPSGTPVSSIGDGIVIKACYSGGFGNLVVIKHSNGYETYYGHLSKYGKGIKKGVKVNQGQIVGYVGMTGLATGPHLDFRIKLNGKFFNFLKMKQPSTLILTGDNKRIFEEKTQNVLNY